MLFSERARVQHQMKSEIVNVLQVNEVNLGNASLDAAVQALKGAAFGPARLGISRPLQQDVAAAAAATATVDNVSAAAVLPRSQLYILSILCKCFPVSTLGHFHLYCSFHFSPPCLLFRA